MALTKETIKKLRAIQAAILAEPELYDQETSPYDTKSCNAPCCIAGWAAWITNPRPRAYMKEVRALNGVSLLEKHLALSEDQAGRLFCNWPDANSPAWTDPGTKAAARDGAERIEHFIRTGGAE